MNSIIIHLDIHIMESNLNPKLAYFYICHHDANGKNVDKYYLLSKTSNNECEGSNDFYIHLDILNKQGDINEEILDKDTLEIEELIDKNNQDKGMEKEKYNKNTG